MQTTPMQTTELRGAPTVGRAVLCPPRADADEPNVSADEVMRPPRGVARARILVRGAVQGVGFRPFVHRLAAEFALAGFVRNCAGGVEVEVEGEREIVRGFLGRITSDVPETVGIRAIETEWLAPVGLAGFQIRESRGGGSERTLIPADLATCEECVREMFDPANRRHRHPFITCTRCVPRFTIVTDVPFDRVNSTMAAFAMCARCSGEFRDPRDRRFHAQAIACPDCGPQLALWDAGGHELCSRDAALVDAVDAIRHGQIVAVKGVGGFHLVAAAHDEQAIRRLRQRKARDAKPFAVMFASIEQVREHCVMTREEEQLLASREAPIVLLDRRGERAAVGSNRIATAVAAEAFGIGAMLAYTPLHHLLLRDLGFPVVATSGNRAGEPICIDEREAVERLRGIADLFLVHDRRIVRAVDDSVARIVAGRSMLLRRARGFAPLPVRIKTSVTPVLAVGAQQKSSLAVAVGEDVFVSQHLGDLDNVAANDGFRGTLGELQKLFRVEPAAIVSDTHPDYFATHVADEVAEASQRNQRSGVQRVRVQHHHAHVLACMAENQIEGPVLGVAWDGTGLGTDGTIWGGEFLCVGRDALEFERVAHLRPFRLPGGEAAVREPRRAAVGLLFEMRGAQFATSMDSATVKSFSKRELGLLTTMLAREVNSPITTSAGRLFDAVASLAGLRQVNEFEGQAAMELEALGQLYISRESEGFSLTPALSRWERFHPNGISRFEPLNHPERLLTRPPGTLSSIPNGGEGWGETALRFMEREEQTPRSDEVNAAVGRDTDIAYPFPLRGAVLDWEPLVLALIADIGRGAGIGEISAKFHNALAEGIVSVARAVGERRVVLSGGCFQNRWLTERAIGRLRGEGFEPFWHSQVPPNDGGIALGQVMAVAKQGDVGQASRV
jgi:hydrogenase maturation protein HypF